jgi:ketosteroid isomerase-like protein
MMDQEFAYIVFRRFIDALSEVDCSALRTIATPDVQFEVLDSQSASIANNGTGVEALCAWTRRVYMECGKVMFEPQQVFDNGNELMSAGVFTIEHNSHTFKSLCLTYTRFQDGKISAFQFLLDTFALQKC